MTWNEVGFDWAVVVIVELYTVNVERGAVAVTDFVDRGIKRHEQALEIRDAA
jgi:hypothetical protein